MEAMGPNLIDSIILDRYRIANTGGAAAFGNEAVDWDLGSIVGNGSMLAGLVASLVLERDMEV